MKTPFTILALWVTALAVAAVSIPLPLVSAKRLSNPATYLLQENFEGTGYDGGTWTETLDGGTINEDYTTTVLQGSQSLYLNDSAFGLGYTQSPAWTVQTVTYGYFQLRISAAGAAIGGVAAFYSGANVRGYIEILSTRTLRIRGNAGANLTTVGAIPTGTLVHVWWSCDATASPETWTLGWSTDGVRPTSGNNYVTGTSDTSSTFNVLRLSTHYTSVDTIIDRVLIDDVQIGDNP